MEDIQSNTGRSSLFSFLATRQMFAISCSQDSTLNNDTDNVNIFMLGDLSSTASSVAVFICINICQQIRANVEHRWMTQLNLLQLSSWCAYLQIQNPTHPLRACELCHITHTRLKLTPSSCLSLGKHITTFWTRPWWITNGFCVWFAARVPHAVFYPVGAAKGAKPTNTNNPAHQCCSQNCRWPYGGT